MVTHDARVSRSSLRPLLMASLLAAIAAPQAAAQDLPAELGSWNVGHTTRVAVDAARADRSLPLDLWYPVDAADATGPPAFYPLLGAIGLNSDVGFEDVPVSSAGVRPLIVFSHGFGGINTQSIHLMEHLASHGFVVVAPAHTGNVQGDMSSPDPEADRYPDVAFVIDEVERYHTDSADAFFGRVETSNVGVAGHSFGGMTAQFMAAGHAPFGPEPRVKAIMPIAASSGRISDAELTSISIPMLLMVGTLDGLQADTARAFGLSTAAPFLYRVDVIGGNHTHFANICDIGNFLLDLGFGIDAWPGLGAGALIAPFESTCIPPAFPIEEATRIQNSYAASFFRRHLLGETYYDGYLTGAYAVLREPDTNFFGGGPAVTDSFLCYKARRTKKTPKLEAPSVSLNDSLESAGFDVNKSAALCSPADVDGGGVGDDFTHLKSYRVKGPKRAKIAGVSVTDRFGSWTLDLLKSNRLLVPASKALGGAASMPGDTLDAYKCYKARISKGTTKFPKGVLVAVSDHLEDRSVDVKKPQRLCMAVDRDGEGVLEDGRHLLCYRARAASGAPEHSKVKGQIQTQDAVGVEQLDSVREDELCVPATVGS